MRASSSSRAKENGTCYNYSFPPSTPSPKLGGHPITFTRHAMTYMLVKHLHVSAAPPSIIFFAVRAWWSVTKSARLQWHSVTGLPHTNDTVLHVGGVVLH